jgi:hypothetical protein
MHNGLINKIIKVVLAIGLFASLYIEYATLDYFTKPIHYTILQVEVLGKLLIISVVVILLNALTDIKWLNDRVVIAIASITFLSWLDFFNNNKVIKVIDSSGNVIEFNSNWRIFIVAGILLVTIAFYIYDLAVLKKKNK